MALVNEPGLQGLGISEKYIKPNRLINILIYCILTRSVSSEVISSLTRVNCCFKTGSSARAESRVLVALKYKWQWDNGGVFIGLIHSSHPEQARTRNTIQDLILSNEILNTGNLGQAGSHLKEDQKGVGQGLFEALTYKVIKVKFMKIIELYSLIRLYNHFINKLSIRTFEFTRLKNQEIKYWYGGRIIEKAKASSNFDDNGSKNQKLINYYIYLVTTKYIYKYLGNGCYILKASYPKERFRYNIWNVLISQRLNSIMFIRSNNLIRFSVRNYSQKNYREAMPSNTEKTIIWNKQNWMKISENVREKQIKLSEIATKFNIYDKRITKLQEGLALSLEFRLLAVQNVIKNKGSKTPGLDGIILNDDQSKSKMVEELKEVLIDNKHVAYKSGVINRVYIPKSNGKLRPLGIPSIKDRCLQELIRLRLDPVVEPFSDNHSYGFRKFRSAKNAIEALRVALQSIKSKGNKYILDVEIKGFFNHINHSWLLKNIPLGKYHKQILSSWLKAGIISKGNKEKKELLYPDEGTPQSGIISPLLGNFILNGLEITVLNSIKSIVSNDFQSLKIKKDQKNGTKSSIRLGIKCIRYADDFVILARSKRILTHYVKPAVVKFLKERGLELSEEKTKIIGIRKEPLDFLGYRLKYQEKWKKYYSFFKDKIGRSRIGLYPIKEKLLLVAKKLKNIIEKSYNESAYSLIVKLNPIIRGWSNYYNLGESTYYRNKLRYYLYKLCWKWAKKKHPKWGKKRIAKIYFLGESSNPFKGRKWTFRGETYRNSRFMEEKEGKFTYLIDPTVVGNTVSGIKLVIPEKIINIHAYDKEYLKLVEFQTRINIMSLGKKESFKGK